MKNIDYCPCGICIFDCDYHREAAILEFSRLAVETIQNMQKQLDAIYENIRLTQYGDDGENK